MAIQTRQEKRKERTATAEVNAIRAEGPERTVTLECAFHATIEDVWALWTTKKGVESWWGPEGFTTEVRALDPRPDGRLEYAMTATGPEQVAAMRAAGVEPVTAVRGTFTEVVPRQRLAYRTRIDFIPGASPYEVATVVEFETTAYGVRIVVTGDRMHDAEWTRMWALGMTGSLHRLQNVAEARQP